MVLAILGGEAMPAPAGRLTFGMAPRHGAGARFSAFQERTLRSLERRIANTLATEASLV